MSENVKKRVLIVDDEEGFARILKLNLEATNQYDVRVENKGSAALQAACEFKPNLILLDIVMPDTEGSQVADQIEETEALKGTPIVFLTAVVSRDEVKTSQDVIGGYPFLAKPVSLEQVIECIERYAL